jgi:ABC-type multidrug transport system fused ATPase/permease subunit
LLLCNTPDYTMVSKISKAFTILSPKAKRRMVLLLPVIIVGMALETLSVGMVLPALGILMSETYFEQFPALSPVLDFFGRPNHNDLIFWGLVGLASVYLIKNAFLFLQVQLQGTFVYSAQREISLQLFRCYLAKGYRFHLETNSSVLIRNLVSEVANFCSFFLMPMLNLITETLVILALLTLVFLIEPQGTIFLAALLGVMVFLFVKATNRVVGKWGKKRLQAEEEKLRHLQQGFGGIKEILLSGKLEFFLRRFHIPNKLSGLMIKREYIFQYVPKLGVEVIAIFGLVAMCLFLLGQGESNQKVTHMLGLMATAGFRMIPSFSRILNNLQSIRYGWPSVNVLKAELFEERSVKDAEVLQTENPLFPAKVSFENEFRLSRITFSYAEGNKVLHEVDLTIRKGEVIGLSGESGSGKSTLANVLLGLIAPDSGGLFLDGRKLVGSAMSSWQALVGYVPQEVYLLDDSIRRNVAFGLDDEEIDDQRVFAVLEMAQLEGFVAGKSDGLDSIIGERGAKLSGGQRQRLGIARALYGNPQVLILDEATSALDQKTEGEFLQTLKPLLGKVTILMIAHRKSAFELCNKVLQLNQGRITCS